MQTMKIAIHDKAAREAWPKWTGFYPWLPRRGEDNQPSKPQSSTNQRRQAEKTRDSRDLSTVTQPWTPDPDLSCWLTLRLDSLKPHVDWGSSQCGPGWVLSDGYAEGREGHWVLGVQGHGNKGSGVRLSPTCPGMESDKGCHGRTV